VQEEDSVVVRHRPAAPCKSLEITIRDRADPKGRREERSTKGEAKGTSGENRTATGIGEGKR